MQNDLDSLKKSTLISRNITVVGRRTSVRLEPEMWNALQEIARREQCRIHDICSLIQLRKNTATSLTAAIRVFLMLYYRAAATEDGHQRARHGDFDQMVQRARMTPDMLKKPSDAESEASDPTPRNTVVSMGVSHARPSSMTVDDADASNNNARNEEQAGGQGPVLACAASMF